MSTWVRAASSRRSSAPLKPAPQCDIRRLIEIGQGDAEAVGLGRGSTETNGKQPS
jgi:hypothetical protein